MKSKKLILSIFGAALAGLWSVQASAAPIGYVELTLDRRTEGGWNGGGRGEFSINRYADEYGNLEDTGIFGSTILYASCIEHAETVNYSKPRWYAIHETLAGAPSSGGMSTDEANLIEQVVSQKFGLDFLQTDNTFNNTEMAKLQSLLWDAGDPGKSATNPTGSWGLAANVVDDLIEELTNIVSIQSYALVRVVGLPPTSGDTITQVGEQAPQFDFNVVEGQDFFTYLAKPDDSTGIPVPAPLLLFGTGLLGLYGASRRRRA
jgi:hypothetical protein